MIIQTSHLGKWIAAKGDNIVAVDTTFTKVKSKIISRKDYKSIRFALIPKGPIAG